MHFGDFRNEICLRIILRDGISIIIVGFPEMELFFCSEGEVVLYLILCRVAMTVLRVEESECTFVDRFELLLGLFHEGLASVGLGCAAGVEQ